MRPWARSALSGPGPGLLRRRCSGAGIAVMRAALPMSEGVGRVCTNLFSRLHIVAAMSPEPLLLCVAGQGSNPAQQGPYAP